MGLPWVRLDTGFAQNPKIAALCAAGRWRSAFVWVAALGYAGAQGTDGYIPDYCLPFIHGTRQNAKDLVEHHLWSVDAGGWSINDWAEFQLSDEAAKKRSDKARKAAMERWRVQKVNSED